MKKLRRQIRDFLLNEDGPTAVEYAVMLALIFLAVIATVSVLGENTSESFEPVRNILASS